MIKNHFGSVASATIRNLAIEKFPLLALVYKLRGTTEIFQVSQTFTECTYIMPHALLVPYLRSYTAMSRWTS